MGEVKVEVGVEVEGVVDVDVDVGDVYEIGEVDVEVEVDEGEGELSSEAEVEGVCSAAMGCPGWVVESAAGVSDEFTAAVEMDSTAGEGFVAPAFLSK